MMISAEKVKYRDSDLFARAGALHEKALLTAHDWEAIESIVQNCLLIGKGLASVAFAKAAAENATRMATAGAMKSIYTFLLNSKNNS
ncbi:hypothetical protein MKJ04_22290 [Pontibacter sp. E15-1]|uniref:hypothetical protein n=1 Tax=Pontibacter sp. E15-1 TaxID=2919918 RepID=UPI001F4FD6E0|nr:hypothetical protein [Pontibacter sp. E15-1]MCJ8167589.1 hypothetical protein [Pontibacter sp. E15-1]